ncbi:MAG: anion permease [Lentisphaerota bacterium]
MHFLLIGITLLMGAAIGWSIGANDAANSLGTAVGSRVLTLRQAILLISVCGFLGAFLYGGSVTKTIGKGIVPLDTLPPTVATFIALVSAFSACCWVVMATAWKMPISTSHSIVGAVAGAGLAVSAPVKWTVLRDIFLCWVLTPLGAAFLGFILYIIVRATLPRMIPEKYSKFVVSTLVIVSGCYVAFTWGSNDVANATGVIAGAGIIKLTPAVLLGGLAIVIGIVTWGYKVIETVGSELTTLTPLMAFSAQLASSLNVHLYTILGVPVSTSHSIVGAIFGVGLVRGLRMLNIKIMREIVTCWIATPFVSGIFSFGVLKILNWLFKFA